MSCRDFQKPSPFSCLSQKIRDSARLVKGTLIPRALVKRMVQRRARSADKPQVFLTHARHARLRVDDVAVVELAGRQLKMAAAHTLGVSFHTIRWDTRGSRHAIA